MAVGVHKAGDDGAVQQRLAFLAGADTADGSILLHLHEGVQKRLTCGERIDIFCSEASHNESLTKSKESGWGTGRES